MREMKLQDLKAKTPAELVSFAEELEVENASTMRKQELMFGILKQLSMRETDIIGEGVVDDIGLAHGELFENTEHQLLLAQGAGIFDLELLGERDKLGRRFGLEVLEFHFPHTG